MRVTGGLCRISGTLLDGREAIVIGGVQLLRGAHRQVLETSSCPSRNNSRRERIGQGSLVAITCPALPNTSCMLSSLQRTLVKCVSGSSNPGFNNTFSPLQAAACLR
jgi:hypothetical protein